MLFEILPIRYLLLAAVLCCTSLTATADVHSWPAPIAAILQQADDKIDLLELKLSVDKAVDPSMDIDATRKRFEAMVAGIQRNLPRGATSMQKLQAIRLYLYGKGSWNNFEPFQYDFSDPSGKNIRAKVLGNYIQTRKGNCVSMPIGKSVQDFFASKV